LGWRKVDNMVTPSQKACEKTSVPSMAGHVRMGVVVTLLERGFSDEHVEAACQQCKTLAGALAWLARQGYKPSRASPRTAARSSHNAASAARGIATPARAVLSTTCASTTCGSTCCSFSSTRTPPSSKGARSQSRGAAGVACASGNGSSLGRVTFSKHQETCAICYDEIPVGLGVRLACRHGWYCESCVRLHTETSLANGTPQVHCPECRDVIQENCLKQLLSKATVDLLHTRSLEQAVASSTNLFSCPTPDCPKRVEVESGEQHRLDDCPMCHKSSCLLCGVQPYHHGLTCNQYAARQTGGRRGAKSEKGLLKWMLKTGSKQCPTCKMAISKQSIEGQGNQYRECHKMLCRNCGTRFCFKCLKVLTSTFSCGCSIDRHGFINPKTGRRVEHLRPRKVRASVAKKQRRTSLAKATGGGRRTSSTARAASGRRRR